MTKPVLIILPWLVGSLLASEGSFPSPADRQASVLNGRAAANPFQGKIDRALQKVNEFSADTTAMVEERVERSASEITKHLTVRMTLFYGKDSNRNRAFVNGKLRRPGDTLMSLLPSVEGISALTLETIARDGIEISWTTDTGKVRRQSIRSDNSKARK